MNNNEKIRDLDHNIEKMMLLRDRLNKEGGTPPLWSYSNYPIFRKYRAHLELHGSLPQWAENADKVDFKIVEAAPPEAPDMEIKKRAALLHLKNNRPTPMHKRPLFQSLVAMLIVSAMVFFNDGTTFTRHLENVSTDESTQKVYRDVLTGERFGTPAGDSLSMVQAADLHSIAGKEIDVVTRWAIDGCYVFNSIYIMASDSTILAEIPDNPASVLSEDLVGFVMNEGALCEERILNSGIEPYDIEVLEVEGVSIRFHKWKFVTPHGKQAEFWRGQPIAAQSPSFVIEDPSANR